MIALLFLTWPLIFILTSEGVFRIDSGNTYLKFNFINFKQTSLANINNSSCSFFLIRLALFIFFQTLLGLIAYSFSSIYYAGVLIRIVAIPLPLSLNSHYKAKAALITPKTNILLRLLVFILELLGSLIKPCATAIRLGANIFCGHLALIILISAPCLSWILICISFITIPWKTMVCFIQTYIFSKLTYRYID